MKFISRVKSLVKFNFRVLFEGKLSKKDYSLEEIHNKLKFNIIFYNNMNEIFQKYSVEQVESIVDLYQKGIKIYNNNIFDIINRLNLKDSLLNNIKNEVNFNLNEFKTLKLYKETFINNRIYYLIINREGNINIKYFQSEEIYSKFNKNYINFNNFIKENLQNQYNSEVFWFRIQLSDHTKSIIKVEISEISEKNIEVLNKIFSSTEFLIENPWLDCSYLDYFIKNQYQKTEFIQKKINLTVEKVFESDQLMAFPDISFDSYLSFINNCIENTQTCMIFMTIYRIGNSEKILNLLKKAVSKQIRVIVNIELNAYGEEINQEWKEKFEKVGVKVICYGKSYMKIHSKITLVLFNSGKIISQIGTGNFHSETTKQYTDLMLFTSNYLIGSSLIELVKLFLNRKKKIKIDSELLITRYNFKKLFIEEINKQIQLGTEGLIIFKCNSFNEPVIVDHLVKALNSGVRVILIIRGIFTWIPEENYKNLTIKSIVWDKLEHSRVYWFGNQNSTCYLGSLDLIKNKISKRIETLVSVVDEEVKVKISKYLYGYITDTANSWIMDCNGNYSKRKR